MIHCNECGVDRPMSDWLIRQTGSKAGQISRPCKPCKSAYMKRYRHGERRPKLLTSNRRYNYLKKYGLDEQALADLLASQDGRCAICRGEFAQTGRRMCVDHDHRTNQVRGILCHNCNVALGLMGDDPELVLAAALYLEGSATRGYPDYRS